ncbi:family 1 putative carbohydrate esterase [Triangularia verruculosa]|uniref:Family 1 putative carbohydrate esterase n=1 Tax=Triangularia verruculosa TaxID=2587418 RepID=A0AAN6XRY6_9PEZI|nr:family 1 putative carbohydrate esterase [Triangularia verruculosa]
MGAQLTARGVVADRRGSGHVYVPDKAWTGEGKGPLVVAIHSCQSSGPSYFANAKIPWRQGSDRKGWDVSSKRSLVRNGGGDSHAIANMILFAIEKYDLDKEKVFVTGGSSGGMMANVMAATYPDLIRAVSLYSGGAGGVGGQSRGSGEQWGNVVRAMYRGYTGPRPKMQIWHGSADGDTPTSTVQNFPERNYRTENFGAEGIVQGIWAQGLGHSVPSNLTASEQWFGI